MADATRGDGRQRPRSLYPVALMGPGNFGHRARRVGQCAVGHPALGFPLRIASDDHGHGWGARLEHQGQMDGPSRDHAPSGRCSVVEVAREHSAPMPQFFMRAGTLYGAGTIIPGSGRCRTLRKLDAMTARLASADVDPPGQACLASRGRVPSPIALASDDRFFAYSGATMG